MTRNFLLYYIRKSFQNDEEWHLFQRDSTLGCRLIQDFDLCKLDECDVTKGHKVVQNHKKLIISLDFFCIELKLSTVVMLLTKFHDMSTVTFPWQHNGLQALSI